MKKNNTFILIIIFSATQSFAQPPSYSIHTPLIELCNMENNQKICRKMYPLNDSTIGCIAYNGASYQCEDTKKTWADTIYEINRASAEAYNAIQNKNSSYCSSAVIVNGNGEAYHCGKRTPEYDQ